MVTIYVISGLTFFLLSMALLTLGMKENREVAEIVREDEAVPTKKSDLAMLGLAAQLEADIYKPDPVRNEDYVPDFEDRSSYKKVNKSIKKSSKQKVKKKSSKKPKKK